METNTQEAWKEQASRELAELVPILRELGFELEAEQPHLLGERYLMQAVTTVSGRKLILLGKRKSDGKRVVIKATKADTGKWELMHERLCREVLGKIRFAYNTFLSPEEILFKTDVQGYTISIQAFIEQESPFTARPLKEQFALALKAFKAQEGAHATTYGHERLIEKTFGPRKEDYLNEFSLFKKLILDEPTNTDLNSLLTEAETFLQANTEIIEQYGGFLTHTDFVPHNIRVQNGEIYLLDHSSLRFGNKYEGWARFTNFMALYNPELERALVEYVRLNRAPEELLSLKLMRVYRLGEIISYYTATIPRSSDNLLELNKARMRFWSEVLRAVLDDRQIDAETLSKYRETRDRLRSEEEKIRQKDLH